LTPQEAIHKLLQAAKIGDLADANAALAAGADPNAVDDEQRTPLHLAAENGHTDLARLLIDEGADLAATDERQWTPLHFAAINGYSKLARLLIEKGADLNARSLDQWTPLDFAAINGYSKLARLLIEKGADLNARSLDQWTPLHFAAAHGHTDLARLLIEKGADPHAKNNSGWIPLDFADLNHYSGVADLLATAGRWHACVKPLLDADRKLDATQLVDQAGQPTESLKNLLPNDLFGELARPDFYRQGMDGLVLVFPYLPEAVQASIDLAPWRRAKVEEANAAAGPDGAVERYLRSRRAPPTDVTR